MWVWLLWSLASAHPVDGTWRLADTPEEVVLAQERASDRTLRSWPRFASLMARHHIVKDNVPCASVVLAVGDTLSFTCGDRGTYVRDLEGSHAFTDEQGQSITSRVSVKDDTLRIVWRAPEGTRTDRWGVAEGALVMEARVTSPHLPRAIVWEQRYAPFGRRPTSDDPPEPTPTP